MVCGEWENLVFNIKCYHLSYISIFFQKEDRYEKILMLHSTHTKKSYLKRKTVSKNKWNH